MYYVVVFKARSETIRFSSLLTSLRVPSEIISTPRLISASCSISVKIRENNLNLAKRLIVANHFYTFIGIFALD